MNRVVALVDDLFFQMKLAETAKLMGIEVKVASTAAALFDLLEPAPKLVVVDLNARANPIEAVERLRAAGHTIRVVAFLSHVQHELAERARAAGCDEVLPRSVFTQNLAAILSQAAD